LKGGLAMTNPRLSMGKSNDSEATTPDADEDAENAVRDTMAALVNSGQRAYHLNVPWEAENLLFARGKGSITRAEANERTRNAIAALVARGALEAPLGRFDWKIKAKAAPPRNKIGFT
jgi:hypothetical protein